LIARSQWNLERPALQIARELHRDGLYVNAASIGTMLIVTLRTPNPCDWALWDNGCSKNE